MPTPAKTEPTPADKPTAATDDSPVLDGATYFAAATAADQVPLSGMFHADSSLLNAQKTLNEWKQALADFLAAPAA